MMKIHGKIPNQIDDYANAKRWKEEWVKDTAILLKVLGLNNQLCLGKTTAKPPFNRKVKGQLHIISRSSTNPWPIVLNRRLTKTHIRSKLKQHTQIGNDHRYDFAGADDGGRASIHQSKRAGHNQKQQPVSRSFQSSTRLSRWPLPHPCLRRLDRTRRAFHRATRS